MNKRANRERNAQIICRSFGIAHVPVIQCSQEAEGRPRAKRRK